MIKQFDNLSTVLPILPNERFDQTNLRYQKAKETLALEIGLGNVGIDKQGQCILPEQADRVLLFDQSPSTNSFWLAVELRGHVSGINLTREQAIFLQHAIAERFK